MGFCNEEDVAPVVANVLMLVLIATVCVTGLASIGNVTDVFFIVANRL